MLSILRKTKKNRWFDSVKLFMQENHWFHTTLVAISIMILHQWMMHTGLAASFLDGFEKAFPRPEASYEGLGSGELGIRESALYYLRIFKQFIVILAVLFIVLSAIRFLAAGGKDDVIAQNKKSIIWVLGGIVVMQVAESIVGVLYGEYGIYRTISEYQGEVPDDVRQKIAEPLIRYFLTFVAAVAVFMIILSGLRMIIANGDDAKIKKQQQVLLWAIIGLVIILIARPVVDAIFGYEVFKPNPSKAISIITQVANYMMSFAAIVSIIIIVYAGILMIMNFGNDATVQKARKMIRWVIIGLIFMISAYTLIVMFITPGTS